MTISAHRGWFESTRRSKNAKKHIEAASIDHIFNTKFKKCYPLFQLYQHINDNLIAYTLYIIEKILCIHLYTYFNEYN